ncbi:MAG: malonyl-ACP O-methyltransferase BioC [Chlorobiaceae bacterium]
MHKPVDKQLVRERFARSLGSYQSQALVQQGMAAELVELLSREHPSPSFGRVLEVGSGSAALTLEFLKRNMVGSYYANDLVGESRGPVQDVFSRFQLEDAHFIEGDIESLKDLPAGLDLVVSNATLQWLGNLEGFFFRMASLLKPGGMLAFSTFSTANMREIATLEGVGLSYHSLLELEALAGKDFEILLSKESLQQMEFASPEAVLHHIRQTGVNGLLRQAWTKSRYQQFITAYREAYSSGTNVFLTYHPVYCCLKRRGS